VLALLSTAAMRELDGWYSWVGSNHRPPVPQTVFLGGHKGKKTDALQCKN
jgi:hypothetical protein